MTAMTPSTLPPKTPAEAVSVYMQLGPFLGTDTITGTPVFASDPPDLAFTYASAIDSGATAAALVSGGVGGTVYVVTAICRLASGQIVEPVVALPVVDPATETTSRSTVTL